MELVRSLVIEKDIDYSTGEEYCKLIIRYGNLENLLSTGRTEFKSEVLDLKNQSIAEINDILEKVLKVETYFLPLIGIKEGGKK